MKRVDRYIVKEFLKPFLFTAVLFSFLVQLGHLFDRMEVFMRNNVPVHVIVPYLFAMLPVWLIQLLPLCTLIAAVVTIGNMSKTGEILCLSSGGLSTKRILRPLFLVGIALTLLTFVLGDTVMPRSTAYARGLYRTYVDKVGIRKTQWDDIIVLAQDHKRISAKHLDLDHNTMDTVTVEEYGDHLNLRQALSAKRAEWDPNHGWTFYDGVIRMFSPEGDEIVEEEDFASAQLKLPETPDDLVPLQIQTEEMSAEQLRRYIKKIASLGISPLRERVEYQFKFAFPFIHILVLSIGLPIAFKTTPAGGGRGKKGFGQMQSLAVALLIAFSYYALVTVGEALGESRKLSPWLAVWIGNFVFLAVGATLTWKVE